MVTILAEYDSDQQFPAFGFGAKAPQFDGMSHCFPLNFNFDQPKVAGLKVLMMLESMVKSCRNMRIFREYWMLTDILLTQLNYMVQLSSI